MQAVSSATQYLDDEVSGVELSTEERHKLTDQLAAAADKKLRDLLQVSSAIVWTTIAVPFLECLCLAPLVLC